MVSLKKSDYERESKNLHRSKIIMRKTKLPTSYKTKPRYCRNCEKQLEIGEMPCKQCGYNGTPKKSRK